MWYIHGDEETVYVTLKVADLTTRKRSVGKWSYENKEKKKTRKKKLIISVSESVSVSTIQMFLT